MIENNDSLVSKGDLAKSCLLYPSSEKTVSCPSLGRGVAEGRQYRCILADDAPAYSGPLLTPTSCKSYCPLSSTKSEALESLHYSLGLSISPWEMTTYAGLCFPTQIVSEDGVRATFANENYRVELPPNGTPYNTRESQMTP